MRPYFENAQTRLFHAEQIDVLPQLPPASYDAVITDPPYCSGGLTAGQRRQDPTNKYAQSRDTHGRPSFGGDLKDQRSFTWWCMSWLIHCRQALKPGGYCLVFIDCPRVRLARISGPLPSVNSPLFAGQNRSGMYVSV